MLLMIAKGIAGGICHSIHRYAKANNKYMKYYDKEKELSYIIYVDPNYLYGWAMLQKLPVDGFEWVEVSVIDEDFIKNYDEDSDVGYIIEADIENPKHLQSIHNDISFLPERINVNKCKKLVCTLHNKK